MSDRLIDDVLPLSQCLVVTCHCGAEMRPIMESKEEVLFTCDSPVCNQRQPQVNVMTRRRLWELEGVAPK